MPEKSVSAHATGVGRRHRPVRLLTAAALAAALLGSAGTAASAATSERATSRPAIAGPVTSGTSVATAANPYERGPAPTTASIEAATGPFATARTTVARSSVSGFGGGTIYYPTTTTAGTFGAIAISPGYYGPQFSIAWYGTRIASQGFVVFTIDTLSLTDSPDSRASQLLAALDYLTRTSTVKTRIDASRLGVMGHSMGGGGALAASATRPSLKASVPLTPYHTRTNFSAVSTPTLIFGAENDTTAPVSSYALPFYNSLPSRANKAFLNLNNASHTAPISANVTIAKYSISWLKRFIDDDTRYEQFLCPLPSGPAIQEYRGNCPHT